MRKRIGSVVLAAVLATLVNAQSFDSTSTGSDGPLNLTTPGVVIFDPASFTPPLNRKHDNIFHFTTINIGPNVTVKLTSKILHSPVFWLAEGDVRIDGIIDLNGDDSSPYSSGALRLPTLAGAGGHAGGVGASNGNAAQAGDGPGAGDPGVGGRFTGNKLLVPLVGGSGGGGSDGAGGGGGGGALLIASSTSITLNGTISANGGNQINPGFSVTGGSGGAIRLVAPIITGSQALLTAKGGAASGEDSSGQNGRIRLEAFQNDLRGDVNGTPISIGKPFKLFLPPDPSPWIRIVSVAGIPVQPSSGGSTELPKITINQSTSVPITVEGHFITPGTVIKFHFFSDDGKDQIVPSTPLTGTFQLSQATLSVPIGSGLTHVFVNANWELESNSQATGKPQSNK